MELTTEGPHRSTNYFTGDSVRDSRRNGTKGRESTSLAVPSREQRRASKLIVTSRKSVFMRTHSDSDSDGDGPRKKKKKKKKKGGEEEKRKPHFGLKDPGAKSKCCGIFWLLSNNWRVLREAKTEIPSGRSSSVGRALDWRSKGPRFNPGFRHSFFIKWI